MSGSAVAGARQSGAARVLKRVLDVTVASTLLVVASPLLALCAGLIALRMGRPILFRQRRPGWRERPFVLVKFRTMRDGVDAQGRLLSDEQRLTTLGRLLRKFSIDELPQMWNVLRGEMSLVGPRPLLTQYLERYSDAQRRRHDVIPGITGWAQVNGRNNLSWERKFELDVWYVDHWSFGLDLKILWMTVMLVLRREGISQSGHATMPEFVGSAGGRGTHE